MRLYGNKLASSNFPTQAGPVLGLLLGAGMWGLVWYPMRLLERGGLDGVWLSVVLYAAALLVSLPWAARGLLAFRTQPFAMVLLALSGGWTNIAFVLAILDGNVLRVMLLFYLSPIWAVALGWLWLRESPSKVALVSLVVAMVGAAAMLWRPDVGFPWPQTRSDWLALSAGFAFALSNATVRKMTGLSLAAKAVSVWVGVVAIGLMLAGGFQLAWPQAAVPIWFGAFALGAFGILAMTLLVQYGVTHMPVHRSAVIMLFELVIGAISQQWLTDETLHAIEWLGGALIIASGYFSVRRG